MIEAGRMRKRLESFEIVEEKTEEKAKAFGEKK